MCTSTTNDVIDTPQPVRHGLSQKVFSEYNFNFPISLVLIHTCVTYIGLRIAVALRVRFNPTVPLIVCRTLLRSSWNDLNTTLISCFPSYI